MSDGQVQGVGSANNYYVSGVNKDKAKDKNENEGGTLADVGWGALAVITTPLWMILGVPGCGGAAASGKDDSDHPIPSTGNKKASVRTGEAEGSTKAAKADVPPGPKEKIADLIKALGDKKEDVRSEAGNKLEEMWPNMSDEQKEAAVDALIAAMWECTMEVKSDPLKVEAVKTLYKFAASIAPAVVDVAGQYLRDDNEQKSLNALVALYILAVLNTADNIKERSVGALVGALVDTREAVRSGAAEVLSEVAQSKDIADGLKAKMAEPVIKALGDASGDVREGASLALGWLSRSNISDELKTEMAGPLVNALGDENEDVRSSACWALGGLARSDISAELKAKMVVPIIKSLGDGNEYVRSNAAGALFELARSGIAAELKAKMIEPFIISLEDKNEAVQSYATVALAGLAWLNISTALKEKMVEPLIKSLGDQREDIRAAASRTDRGLSELGGDGGLTSTAEVSNAARTLTWLVQSNISERQKAKIVDAIIQCLGDKDEDVRINAARALRLLAKERAGRGLAGLVFAENISDDLKVKIVGAFIKCLGDENKEVLNLAAMVLLNLAASYPEDISIKLKARMVNLLIKSLEYENRVVMSKALIEFIGTDIPPGLKNKIIQALEGKGMRVVFH